MEGGVVADFGVDLVEGNVFQERSVRFAFVICACEFCESGGEKLLFVDHNEVKFVQRRRKVVRKEAHSIKEIINRVVVRCEDEQLGALGCGELAGPRSRTESMIVVTSSGGRPVEKTVP